MVLVVWGDAHVKAGWGHIKHAPEEVESLGYVVTHDEVGISIAKGRSLNQDGAYQPLTVEFIPNGMITEVKDLK